MNFQEYLFHQERVRIEAIPYIAPFLTPPSTQFFYRLYDDEHYTYPSPTNDIGPAKYGVVIARNETFFITQTGNREFIGVANKLASQIIALRTSLCRP